jgi:hypothetical protein
MSVFRNVLIALDQAANCLFRLDGEWGEPDETLSARAWRVREKHPRWAAWINVLFFWDTQGEKRHCELAYDNEVKRAHLPNVYRDEGP